MNQYFLSVEQALFRTRREGNSPIKSRDFDVRSLNPLSSGTTQFNPRQSTALLIAAKAAGLSVVPGARVPRSFSIRRTSWVIENGCGQDIVRSRSAGYLPAEDSYDDEFVVTLELFRWITDTVEQDRLRQFQTESFPLNLTAA